MAPSSSRNGARVIWVAVHTAEGIRKASDLKAYFDRSTNSSAHACADDNVLLDHCVPYDRAAWTLRRGNPISDNLELCGFAKWTRDEWLTHHKGMLNHAAAWIRSRCVARGIPIRKIGPAEVAKNQSGVFGHVDYTNGKRDGTHWDPGPGFPWDYVINRAAGGGDAVQEDTMSAADAYNGFAQLLKDVDGGRAEDLKTILDRRIRIGAYNAVADVLKDLDAGRANDLKAILDRLASERDSA